jgi:hypothetical protein
MKKLVVVVLIASILVCGCVAGSLNNPPNQHRVRVVWEERHNLINSGTVMFYTKVYIPEDGLTCIIFNGDGTSTECWRDE